MDKRNVAEAIERDRAMFVDAVGRGDAQAASLVYAEDAHLLAPTAAPIVGREDIRAFWQAGFDAGVAAVSFVVDEAGQNDGLAYETGTYAFRVEPGDGGRVVEHGHYGHVHERRPDGSWQRTVEIFSPEGTE
jgi:ketosteroid isomerase-like protein